MTAHSPSYHRRLERVVVLLLLPAFFAFAGLRTDIGLLSGWYGWTITGLIIVVATVGKFGGTFIAARLSGLAARQAAALGVLMNTRGLMELIVLNVGLELGVISPTLFDDVRADGPGDDNRDDARSTPDLHARALTPLMRPIDVRGDERPPYGKRPSGSPRRSQCRTARRGYGAIRVQVSPPRRPSQCSPIRAADAASG